jgi:ectoine hydroxylase-related dioxygenase (phytanoyl-CoA dioxygenase family)
MTIIEPRPHPANVDFVWEPITREPRLLTAEQVRQFDEQGYVLVPDVIDLDAIAEVRDAIDRLEVFSPTYGRDIDGTHMEVANRDEITFTIFLVVRCEPARRFARHPALVGICRDLVGPDVRLYWDQAVYKKPEPTREFPWHQDNGYTFVEPQQYLTCWVPLVDATVDNGCPWILPGLHRGGTLVHEATPVGFQCLSDGTGAVPVEAPAGSVVVFSSLTPHRTGPNRTDAVRKSYILQYAPDGAEAVDTATGTRIRQDDPTRQFPVLRDGVAVTGDD